MNRLRKTIITATVALTMVGMIAPVSAGAVTIAELQAQINALMAQLQSLQGSQTGSVPAACSGVTFLRNLRVGSTGSDVKCLQASMNALGYTVATTGAGSPGSETTYFGSRTLAAARAYQAAKGWIPADQVGPLTRAALNTWLSGTVTPPPPGTPPVPTGAGLTAQLASDNPAAGTVVDASALHPMLKLVFLNGDNAEVKVTGLKLKRIGVSADASVTNTYLFNGANRLTDGAAVSETMINFNNSGGLFMVPAGGSVTITVRADVDGTASETVGIQLVSAANVTSNASSVQGVFPITGNLQTVATGTLAGVNFNTSTTPAAASIDPQDDYTVWQNSTTVTTRAVDLQRISFRKTGSVSNTDLQNFMLYIDGVQVGATQQLQKDSLGSDYVTFDLTSSPKRMEAGTRVIKVLADIIGGSNLNFTTHLWNVADATFVDSQYAANILAQSASATFSKRSTGAQTVNSGTLTITKKTDSPSGDIVNAAANQTYGRWELRAAGEKVKVENLKVRVIFTNTVTTGDDTATSTSFTIRNGALFANGVQVGSTTSTTDQAAGTQFNLGSSLIVDPLSPVTLEFKGDVFDNAGSNNDLDDTDTMQASLVTGSSNGTGMVSATTLNVPSAAVNANVMSVKEGSLTLSKYTAYTNQTVVAPQTAYKVGHFTLTAHTAEAVNINTIRVDTTFASLWFNNLYVKYGTQTTPSTATISAATTSYSVNYQLAAGQTIDVMVFADISSSATSGAGAGASVLISGTTAGSGVSVNTNSNAVLAGQTITYSTGAINAVVDGTTPVNMTVAGNQSVTSAKFKIVAQKDAYTVSELRFTVQGNNGAVISNASLWNGASLLSTQPFDSANNRIAFTGLGVSVPKDTTKVLSVSLNLVTPFTDATVVTTGKNLAVTLSYLKAINGTGVMHDAGSGTLLSTDSGTTIAGSTTGTSAANYVYAFKTLPTFTVGTLDTSSEGVNLTAGSTTQLYKLSVAADSKGDVSLRQLKFSTTVTDPNLTDGTFGSFKFFRGSTDMNQAGTVYIRDASGTDLTVAATLGTGTVVVTFYPEVVITAGTSETFTLKATPANFASASGTSDTVATNLPTDSTPAGVSAGADVARYFLAATGGTGGTGNTGIQALNTTANQSSGTAANVIWSDNSAGGAVPHEDDLSASTSADWFNGYLIKNTPLDSIGIAAK